ncbi:MAG: PHP domain-containing protein [SAR202 cluster bacterium]|nr:PHP domain-containing protein [SAR202 cluster bacterium]
MPFFFDLHVHTVRGSSDSGLLPAQLVENARRIGLSGVCLTEHGGWSDRREFDAFAQSSGLVVVHGLEVDTDLGHVLVLGVDSYQPGMSSLRELRRVVQRAGGFMILAHPYRNMFNPPPYNKNLLYGGKVHTYPHVPQEAVGHHGFELVDAVEVVNGANTDPENWFAQEVTRLMGRKGTGGSDAHSIHGLGKGVTAFNDPVRNEGELIEALRAQAFVAAEGLHIGNVKYVVNGTPGALHSVVDGKPLAQ